MKKGIFVFLEFLIGGIFLGIIEDVILIKLITGGEITPLIFLIIFLITLPFAFIGEYVVDRIDLLEILKLNKKYRKIEVFFEFLIFGVLLGIVEDLTAFYFAIGDPITLKVIFIAGSIAVPFAFVSEILLDRIHLSNTFENKKITLKNPEIK